MIDILSIPYLTISDNLLISLTFLTRIYVLICAIHLCIDATLQVLKSGVLYPKRASLPSGILCCIDRIPID